MPPNWKILQKYCKIKKNNLLVTLAWGFPEIFFVMAEGKCFSCMDHLASVQTFSSTLMTAATDRVLEDSTGTIKSFKETEFSFQKFYS